MANNALTRTVSNVIRFFDRKSASIFMWPSWRQGTPLWKLVDYESYAADGFGRNSVMYSAISYKARATSAAPLTAWTGDANSPERLDADNPLAMLVRRPNPYQSFDEFFGLGTVYLNIDGNAYGWIDRGTTEEREEAGIEGLNTPLAVYLMRPDRVFIIPGQKEGRHVVLGYLYVPEGKSAWEAAGESDRRQMLRDGQVTLIPTNEVMHVKLPNPMDPLEGLGYGLSPVAPIGRVIDVDNSVTHFLQLFFKNGVMLPGILKTDKQMTDQIAARVRARFKEMYGGYQEWAEELAVLENGIEYQRIGLTFDEMGFETLDDRSESRILSPFGVPPILIGTRIGLNRSTYANYKEARQAFWDDTMVPENNLWQADFQYFLNEPDQGWFVSFDYSRTPAFSDKRKEQRDDFYKAFTAGAITRNEYRRMLNLEPVEDGEVYILTPTQYESPVGLLPSTTTPDDNTEEGAPVADDEDRKAYAMTLTGDGGVLIEKKKDSNGSGGSGNRTTTRRRTGSRSSPSGPGSRSRKTGGRY